LADVSEPSVSSIFKAFEDGTDTGFRNVGQLQFDVGEIPKRTYTKHLPVIARCLADCRWENNISGIPNNTSGTPNNLNFCVIFIVYTQFTNVVTSRNI